MKDVAYLILVNERAVTKPFKSMVDVAMYVDTKQLKGIVIKEVELSEGDIFRSWNTVLRANGSCLGIVVGVYYEGHPEHIKLEEPKRLH